MTTTQPRQLEWNDATLSRFWAYHSRFPESYFSWQKGADVLKHVARQIPAGATVLDYGCGPGHLLPYLLDAGYQVVGADITLDAIGSAVDVSERPGFMGYSTVDGVIAEGRTFDAVFLIEVVEHLDDHWLAKTLDQARALLKPAGVLVVTTPNEERLEDSMVYCPVSDVVFHRWQHMRSWSAASLAAALRRHGFGKVETETLTFPGRRAANVSPMRYMLSGVLSRYRKAQSLLAIARP